MILIQRKTKQQIKFREEDFGYLIAKSDGTLSVVNKSAGPFLKQGNYTNLDKFKLEEFQVRKNFYLRAPVVVYFEITRDCNLKCKHCYIYGGKPRKNEFTKDEIFTVLDDLKRADVFFVLFTGGEPLIHKDIVEIVNYAKELGFFVAMVTNGIKLNNRLLKSLSKKAEITLSLDGTMNVGSQREGVTFNLMKEKIEVLKNSDLPFTCICALTKLTVDDAYELADYCVNQGITLTIFETQLLGRAKECPEMLLTPDDVPKVMKAFEKKHEIKELHKPLEKALEFVYNLEFATGRCKGGRAMAYIAANGDVYPCSSCAAEELFLAGNVRDKRFIDIWKKSFRDIRSITWDDFKMCKDCDIDKTLKKKGFYCKCRCPPLSKNIYGDLLQCGATDYLKESMLQRAKVFRQLHQK